MAIYKSSYTGPQIDEGITKANEAATTESVNFVNQRVNVLSGEVSTNTQSINNLANNLNETNENVVSNLESIIALAEGKQDKLTSGSNIKTINGNSLLGEGNITIESGGLTENEVNTLIDNKIVNKQDKLVSGTNIKTINNQSILGSGNIEIQGGAGGGNGILVDLSGTIIDITSEATTNTIITTDAIETNANSFLLNLNTLTGSSSLQLSGFATIKNIDYGDFVVDVVYTSQAIYAINVDSNNYHMLITWGFEIVGLSASAAQAMGVGNSPVYVVNLNIWRLQIPH